jgi:hypothetical protein
MSYLCPFGQGGGAYETTQLGSRSMKDAISALASRANNRKLVLDYISFVNILLLSIVLQLTHSIINQKLDRTLGEPRASNPYQDTLAPPMLPLHEDGQPFVILIVGYDEEICNTYGKKCQDSKLSRAFAATGDALELSLEAVTVRRIDVKQLELNWLGLDMRGRESHAQALLRTLGEVGAEISTNKGRLIALIYVGHGFGKGEIGPTLKGQNVNLIEAAQQAQLAEEGAVIALACSVAVDMDLSHARIRKYRVFATEKIVEWMGNGSVKFSGQSKSAYKSANSFSLPEQTNYGGLNHMGIFPRNQSSSTIQEVVRQAARRVTMRPFP